MAKQKPTIHTDRIQEVAKMMGRGLYKSEIKTILSLKWGVCRATVLRYFVRATKLIGEHAQGTPEYHKGCSLQAYYDLLKHPKAKIRDKIKAQERIDHLLGLDQPQAVNFPVNIYKKRTVAAATATATGAHHHADMTLRAAQADLNRLERDNEAQDAIITLARRQRALDKALN